MQGCQIKIKNKLTLKDSQTQQKVAKLLEMVAFYLNIIFFTGNQSFKALLPSALYFIRKRIGFQHFTNISK